MHWLVTVSLVSGEWYRAVVVAQHDKAAIEIANDHFLDNGYEVDNVVAEPFEVHYHGDIVHYEILN